MKKKIILLPLCVTVLGLTSCKEETKRLDNTVAANEMYDAFVATSKKANAFGLKIDFATSTANVNYRHHYTETLHEESTENQNYNFNLTNSKFTLDSSIAGLRNYTEEKYSIYNDALRAALTLKDVALNGNLQYVENPHDTTKYTDRSMTIGFDNHSLDKVSAYIDHSVLKEEEGEYASYYGGYVDFGSQFATELEKMTKNVEFTSTTKPYNDNMRHAAINLNSVAKKTKKDGGEYNKVYASLASIPIISKIAENGLEILLGDVGKTITTFAKGEIESEEKAEIIKNIKEVFVSFNGNDSIGDTITKSTKDSNTIYTLSVDAAKLNKLFSIDTFNAGKLLFKVTLNSKKEISKIDLGAEGLKTKEFVVSTGGSSNEDINTKYFTFNDFTGTIGIQLDYSSTYAKIAEAVRTAVSTGGWNEYTVL